MDRKKEIERSLITKFRKDIYSKFVKAVSDYKLINENDKIMVCISGGKDSFLLAKCIEELIKHGKFKFEAEYVVMNPGYKPDIMKQIKKNAKILGIDIKVFDSDIFEVANKLNPVAPCYMCARMRRGFLYSKAKELGCNKIALGHHFNDVIETSLLAMLYSSEVKTMLPKLHSENFEGLELIRPLYLVHEDDIISFAKYNNLEFINCACSFTDSKSNQGKRLEIKMLIKEIKKVNKNVESNIFTALDNINLNCVLGYKKNNKTYSFLDDYED